MRSVYIFASASADQIRSYLDSVVPRTGDTKQWIYPSREKSVLYIEPTNSLYEELDPEILKALSELFGTDRAQCICIDVSSRFSGEQEVEHVTLGLLRHFGGVAIDDYGDHLWTKDEIEASQEIEGRLFFRPTVQHQQGPRSDRT